MFGKRITLFKLFGFEVRVDLSWIVILILIVWSLAQGLFPYYYKGLSQATYWWMGIAGAIGLFISIIIHEMCHSLVARKYGLPMKGITLFIFGGVAEMDEEPPNWKAEFFMAIAGPLASIGIGVVTYFVVILGGQLNWNEVVIGVLQYILTINLVLAAFNLIPAFPLDGGRVLRSILWRWKKNIYFATRIASGIGSGFGLFMIFFGVFSFVFGAFTSGIWWFLIGMFLRWASQTSYQQLVLRRGLEGETVQHFMKTDPITVSPDINVQDLVNNYIYHYHYRMFPVVSDNTLVGCVSTKEIRGIPHEEWANHAVKEVSKSCSNENTIKADESALKALTQMRTTGNSRLMVTNGNSQLSGIITLRDLMHFISLKLDIESGEDKNVFKGIDSSDKQ